MRVAIFTNTYWPTVNGVAISVENMRQGLLDLGHEVYVFASAPSDFDTSQDQPNIIRFPSVAAPVEADYYLAVPYSQPAAKVLRDLDFDVIHTHHPVWVGVWGQWYARWTGTPLVTTVHTQYEVYSKLIPLPDAVVEAFLRVRVTSYCNKCQVVTTPAESARRRLIDSGVTVPVEVVYNPTDLSPLEQADGLRVRNMVGCGKNDIVLGYVGRIAPEKNIDLLLRAADAVMQQHAQVHLLIVGDGPTRERMEKMARSLSGSRRIHFVGAVPHPEIPDYQSAIDLFMTASRFEVQPLSFAEAMAAGAPVIAMKAPGAYDMIEDGHNGRLVPLESGSEGLARAAAELVASPDKLARMSQNARQWSRRYDRPQVIKRLLEVYELAIQRGSATSS